MLDNNKCILVYNVPESDVKAIEKEGYKIIIVKDDMTNMTIKDILEGFKFETFNPNTINESVILFNNFLDEELKDSIKKIRETVKGGILATVTEHSVNWEFNYLAEHLAEEREWFLKQQKGRA
ncbi:DUF3783 domain-containing protein [Clostridium sp.]|uniref:DUF3783 domain-containing protein n=1 Tax=Clostridium sp. TaxID=1506 RepID=UPI002621DC19|nr:DUF3783 domain-containing protein [Clostridium sp.]